MKPVQWIIAFLVLVVMVFLITFGMQYLSEGQKPLTGPLGDPTEKVLVFPNPKHPAPGSIPPYVDLEQRKEGHHDFLFENTTDEEVKIGLISRNCKCAGVALLLASDEIKAQRVRTREAATGGGLGLAMLAEHNMKRAPESLKPVAQLDTEKDASEVKVPARATGWLRLQWAGEKTGPQLFSAKVWVKRPNNEAATLEAQVRYSEAVRFREVNKEIVLSDDLTLEEMKQGPKKYTFTIWSSTRTSLKPKVGLYSKGKTVPLPVEFGTPIPLTAEELKKLEAEVNKGTEAPERVLCAYRLPVELHLRSSDGKVLFPFGPFRVRMEVKFEDKDEIEPSVCYIKGKLLGDVRTGGQVGTDDDRLYFGSFMSNEGCGWKEITLYSDVSDLKLEIDKERTPAFLRDTVKIEDLGKTATGTNAWKVKAKVAPNKVIGQFPREDNEFYDCAVYVKVGDGSRILRIPAYGTADTR